MKKVLSFIFILISFLIIYLLQSNFFTWFNIAGVKPNLFIILMVFIGAFMGKYYGFGIGVFLGLLLDMFIGKVLGLNAIILGLVGLFGGLLTKTFSKDSKMTMIVLITLITFASEIVSYIYQMIIFGYGADILIFLKIIIIEVIFNTLLLIILYPLLKKAGEKLEKIFTEDKILTRYY